MIYVTIHALPSTPILALGRDALVALNDLVGAIDHDGIAARGRRVLAIVDLAEAAGIRPGLTTVLVEPAASRPTREKAFALLAMAIGRTVGELAARTDHAA